MVVDTGWAETHLQLAASVSLAPAADDDQEHGGHDDDEDDQRRYGTVQRVLNRLCMAAYRSHHHTQA